MISSRWKAVLAALFLFIAGIAVGVLGTFGYGLHQIRAVLRNPAAASRFDRALDRVQTRLVKELDLDATQAAAVRAELDRTAAEMRTLRVETVQRTRRTLAESIARIGAGLPPEKRSELRQLIGRRLGRLGLDLPDSASEPAPASEVK